jgi:hypothetical protein
LRQCITDNLRYVVQVGKMWAYLMYIVFFTASGLKKHRACILRP